jgi:gliding motility-associated-like protein
MYARSKNHLLSLFCLFLGINSTVYAQTQTIPVVVHVMHRYGYNVGFGENITPLKIQQGIDKLNAAFAAQAPFGCADCAGGNIQFCLAQQDPQGLPTLGYTRTLSPLVSSNFLISNDAALKNEVLWDPTRYLNIWLVSDICAESDCSPTAYAYSDKAAGSAQDGLVCEAVFWSTKEGAAMSAHELGHYLGLKHTYIGGCNNSDCSTSGDGICDTPPDNTVFEGCVAHNSCGLADYNWNFMDANTWGCLQGFTTMQQKAMDKILHTTRKSLLESKGCEPPCALPATANIATSQTTASIGESLNFTINGTNIAQNQWFINNNFINSTNALTYTFTQAGTYMVCLSANNATNCSPVRDTIYIRVQSAVRPRIYVNAAATGMNTGASWQNAFTDLQNALTTPNTEIWVTSNTQTAQNTAFSLPDGAALYGGFSGTETTLQDRNIHCKPKTKLTTANPIDALLKVKNLPNGGLLDGFEFTAQQNGGTERGAVFVENSDLKIENCVFIRNWGYSGAGLVVLNNTNKTVCIAKTKFLENQTSVRGAAIWAENTNLKAENLLFVANTQTNQNNADGSVVYINDVTNGNYSFNHCTFTQNEVTNAVIHTGNPANLTIKNSIIQKNQNTPFAISGDGSDFAFSNISASQTTTPLTNCIAADPDFFSVLSNDFRLSANSPCLNTGANTLELTDLDGMLRIVNSRTDMGCYEYATCPKITATATLSNARFNCGTGNTADVKINANTPLCNSTLQYEYQNTSNATGIFTALQAGEHYIKIHTNNPQCKDSIRVFVQGKKRLYADAQTLQHACKGAYNGVFMTTISGGQPPYTYTLNGLPITKTIVTRLPPNSYTIKIVDANNCLASANARIEEVPGITVTAKVKSYNCDSRTATLLFETSSGTVAGFAWSGFTRGNGIAPDSIRGLSAGDYVVTITSSNGCSATTTARIGEITPITANTQYRNPHCIGGTDGDLEVINVQNAVAPVLYSINNGTASASPVFPNLRKGTYNVRVEDRNNCKWERAIILEDGEVLKARLNRDTVISIGDSAYLRTAIQPATAAVQYAWNNTENLSCYDCANPRAFPLVTTTYIVTITDAFGCSATSKMVVTVINNKAVYVPNVFSPNNDGINDFLSVYSGGAAAQVQSMRIFNRWGGLMYESKNFPVNNPFFGWNGMTQTEHLDTGVYLYEVEVRFLDNEVKTVRGNVTLVRKN